MALRDVGSGNWGRGLGWEILRVFSSLSDSMVLCENKWRLLRCYLNAYPEERKCLPLFCPYCFFFVCFLFFCWSSAQTIGVCLLKPFLQPYFGKVFFYPSPRLFSCYSDSFRVLPLASILNDQQSDPLSLLPNSH